MDELNWIDNLNRKDFRGPFHSDTDNHYFRDVKELLCKFVDELTKAKASISIVSTIENYCNNVIDSIDVYYKGNILQAQLKVNELISEFNNFPAISNINDSIAFPYIKNSESSEVQFYRARLSDNVIDFPGNEMLHIPFNKREIVKSERFSIPGLPCLYLANSSYCCWIEMGRPADYRFNVSPVVLDNTQKVLNLAITIESLDLIKYAVSNGADAENYSISILKLLILAMASSYKIDSGNRNFKSEYILPQMIMLACKDRDLDGITYYTKQTEELFSYVVGVNIVLFATFNGEEKLSSICNHIQIGESFNFSMYKQLLACQTYKTYPLRIDQSIYFNNIGTTKRQFPYKETQFYEFDNYLFANWNKD